MEGPHNGHNLKNKNLCVFNICVISLLHKVSCSGQHTDHIKMVRSELRDDL